MADLKRKISVGEVAEESLAAGLETGEGVSPEVDLTQVFEWNSEEFEYHEKGSNWKWGLVVVAALFVLLFSVTGNWTAAILAIVAAVVIYQYAFKRPRVLHYIISRDGVTVGEQTVGFNQFSSYWISNDGWLYFNKKWRPRLTIKLDSVNAEELDAFLGVFLEKVARSDRDSADRWSNVLKL